MVKNDFLTLGRVDEIGGDVAPVKLEAFNDLQLIMQSFAILWGKSKDPNKTAISISKTHIMVSTKIVRSYLHSNHTLPAYFLHCIRDDRANLTVSIGRNSCHLPQEGDIAAT